jgi:hypothetical protein
MKCWGASRAWKLAVLSIVMLGIVVLVAGCPTRGTRPRVTPIPTPAIPTTSPTPPEVKVENSAFFFPQRGPRVIAMKFAALKYDPSSGLMTMTGAESDLYKEGKAVLHVVAPRAVAAVDGKNIRVTMQGTVTAVAVQNRMTLTAENLRWTSKGGKLVGMSVRLSGNGFVHEAASGTMTTDLSHVVFTDVRTAYHGRGAVK